MSKVEQLLDKGKEKLGNTPLFKKDSSLAEKAAEVVALALLVYGALKVAGHEATKTAQATEEDYRRKHPDVANAKRRDVLGHMFANPQDAIHSAITALEGPFQRLKEATDPRHRDNPDLPQDTSGEAPMVFQPVDPSPMPPSQTTYPPPSAI